MKDSRIITAVTPINVGIVKYFNDPKIKSFYPIDDYFTVALDPDVTCAIASVCARRNFTNDEFWLNGKRDAYQLAFCLNEVKYRAATQRTVSIEFLTRKVHIACENNFSPSLGTASFVAGFISVMQALCKLYKINPNSIKNQNIFPGIVSSPFDVFVQRRELYEKKNVNRKQIAGCNHWPELRVLILMVKRPTKGTSTEPMKGADKTSQCYHSSKKPTGDLKMIAKAIKQKDFATFAEASMRNNYIDAYTYPPHARNTANKVTEVVLMYNKLTHEVRAAYMFDVGPNVAVFFLKKDAQEIISLFKYIFPSSKPDFIRGLNTRADLDPEYFRNFPIQPMVHNPVKYAYYSKIGNVNVQVNNENHLLDENGDLKVRDKRYSPSNERTTRSSESSGALDGYHYNNF